MHDLTTLSPAAVWSHFATLCAIPRASLHEAALREHLLHWAAARGIAARVDEVGNLILHKPASPGCEAAPGVILQGHLDMVCQANAGTVHDFARDPIRPVIKDGWVVAEHTTLGADNGIGVALALAALEEPTRVHPALEVLLTVNEESGMDGARGLAPGSLQGRVLLNLDTEEWGHFYLGCAGGMDVEVTQTLTQPLEREPAPPGYLACTLEVGGLRGGHSGIDIHLGRGNALLLLGEALAHGARDLDMRLLDLEGGTARNAIPREARARVAVPPDTDVHAWAQARLADWRARLGEADPGVSFTCSAPAPRPGTVLVPARQERLLAWLTQAPNGVAAWSAHFSEVVETSSNLGLLHLTEDRLQGAFLVRSLDNAQVESRAEALAAHARAHGLTARKTGAYPGWTPNPESAVLALCQRVYASEYGQAAGIQVIHAGLECGLLAASHPHLDMISFGPDIRGAHAPGERVDIASVQRCWHLLGAVLGALAQVRS